MVETRYLSTATVAQALGVSVTTVKRWVDEGVLPAHKTPGGHRKIPLSDVLRLIHEKNWPQANLSLLTAAETAAETDTEQLSRQLLAALRHGQAGNARTLMGQSYRAGIRIEQLADEVVAPTMARLGHDWEQGQLDIFHEHRGTQICLEALLDLKARFDSSDADVRPLALGGSPEGDPYLLASLLAQMVLLEGGWDAVNLGPNTPLRSLGKAVKELRPRLVWLSCGYLTDSELFLREYKKFYEEADQAGAAVALGGRALTPALRSRMPYTTFGDGLTHLAAFARSLHPRPERSRRKRSGR